MRESDGLIFGPEIRPGKPALRSVALSVALHGAAAAVLLAVPSRLAPAPEKAVDRSVPSPTEIRIGDRIYFVADLSAYRSAADSKPAAKRPDTTVPLQLQKRQFQKSQLRGRTPRRRRNSLHPLRRFQRLHPPRPEPMFHRKYAAIRMPRKFSSSRSRRRT